jgi:hypothetical protein
MQKFAKMTPAEMQQELLRLQEVSFRAAFVRAGYNDLELQDTVWQFLLAQEKARTDVRKAARKMYLATEPKGAALTNPQFEAAIADYQAVAKVEKARREAAIQELDEKIDFSHKPKLKALLLLNGYIGDEAWYTGQSFMASTLGLSTITGIND